ncbi:type II toxin-antitoxin system ParD family antitoxin [Phenylobacterium sp.]|uniref:ribbon-helix-helix domain-containing protein n=1 Tax=Phenylobacterium sp. TaxID=1871053 RepID=UPI0025E42094|nr:type II toxin-antitoxin system ParD family antitoxin [Phenylobacterium sp.]MBX3485829.1 type II toxin-antitoxin system ParD family antitoxin [Phenylobacterium sp.]
MRIDLPPDLEAIVDDLVGSGRYTDPIDVARAALALLDDEFAHFRALQREIEIGAGSPAIERPVRDVFADVKRRGREELAARRAAE